MKKLLTIILILPLFAQTVSDFAYTGAKVSAMAGAVVAEKGNNWSIFHNPAGITEIDGMHFSLGSGKIFGYDWLPAINLSGTTSLPIIGKIGFAFQQLETKYSGTTLSKEQTLSIAQGFDLQHDKNSQLAIGYTANFVQWNLGKSAGPSGDGSDGLELGNVNAVSVDFGVLASLREKYRFGVFLKNVNSGALGKGMTRQILPRRINVGITYMPMTGLATSIVSEHLLGRDDMQIKSAIRYNLNSNVELYTGAQSNPNRFGMGATFTFNNQSVSYGLLTHPVLPMTHQFNIGLSL
ncbi:MAG: type IX secretion system membrane protein PorP/SprF [Candidatus Marinimicrobia bacterium]|nr:type IX secretion system membrane protein PorP/SprF [Candidatus Neomarinimicrobiota bacterium]